MTKESSPITPPILILQVLAEGGGLDLYGHLNSDGVWQFSREVNDSISEERATSHPSGLVDTWRGALKLLDKYEWHLLYPGDVHPEFAERIWQAYERRWKKTPVADRIRNQTDRIRDLWQSACGKNSGAEFNRNESEMPEGEVPYEYFEYDGHALVRVAVTPYCGADIFVNGKWESRNLARTSPSLFPMTEDEAMDIIKSVSPK